MRHSHGSRDAIMPLLPVPIGEFSRSLREGNEDANEVVAAVQDPGRLGPRLVPSTLERSCTILCGRRARAGRNCSGHSGQKTLRQAVWLTRIRVHDCAAFQACTPCTLRTCAPQRSKQGPVFVRVNERLILRWFMGGEANCVQMKRQAGGERRLYMALGP